MSTRGQTVQDLADRMLALVRARDLDRLTTLVRRVVGKWSPERHLLRPLLSALVDGTAAAVRRAAAPVRPEHVFVLDITDEHEHEVGIDEVRPPLRAMLRAVLALLNGRPEDADYHVDLVAEDRDPVAQLEAVVHTLRWTASLSGEGPVGAER
ncbi:hypothetical protein SAMN05421810_101393 [Amycolatopsis arida]|uniref:Uncharacterized protein n=1 Tax=Amycolatopsis arida TaxID=587909 RepID=A0A1I5L3L5_9PSEU|nr:hypothetical protein [Amycolatopsis arida]TDX93571.1 hypothetical protein CLV69_10426 [Amycolatopsis arida]SFO91884.1 hypothetical protein SAMN05421810_101393 [Amycolatopsis arida]